MRAPYSFSRQGRTWKTALIVAAIYGACISAIVLIDAAWWLMSVFSLMTIPALLDLWFNPKSGLDLTQTALNWSTGRRQGTLNFSEINSMRFDTRLDFSVRVTAILHNKKQVRLPYESLPPHGIFETELQARDVKVGRHHFVVI